ncbi:MAG: DinB family protein [Planctomycetota bacterium]
MESIELIRGNLRKSRDIVLSKIEAMREHGLVFPTPRGGSHTIWVLGHLAYIEGLVVTRFAMGEDHPRPEWKEIFDGGEVPADPTAFPGFDETLAVCRAAREETIARLDGFSEADLDRPSPGCPAGVEDTFGTWRHCFQFVADHWYMHRGQLADARRAAAIDRMWF